MRMQGHIQDVKNLFINSKSSDSFASHFTSLVPEGTTKKNVKDFVKVKVDILWQMSKTSSSIARVLTPLHCTSHL
jgi:hypothetical protein